MAKRRSKLGSPWSIPGWIVTTVAAVDVLGNIEWVATLGQNRYAKYVWDFVQTPGGGVVALGVGIIWLAICARTPLKEPEVETGGRVRVLPVPVPRRAAEPVVPQEPDPNIIVLETGLRGVEVDEHGLMKESHRPSALAATISFRNDVLRGKPAGYMNHTRAHLRFDVPGKKPVHVDAGYWLGSQYNTVDIGPGETWTLIAAVIAEPGKSTFVVVPDDRRENYNKYEAPQAVRIEAGRADVSVKLVGGWNAEHVAEFRFVLHITPEFKLEEA